MNRKEIDDYLTDRQGYDIEPERQSDMEIFHERTKYYPSTILNKSLKVGSHMVFEGLAKQVANNFKPYLQSRKMTLPKPLAIDKPLGDVQLNRKSTRDFSGQAMSQQELSSILFHAGGATREEHLTEFENIQVYKRVYPSAGNLFPIEQYLLLLNIEGLSPCIVHYDAVAHELDLLAEIDDLTSITNALCDNENTGKQYTENLCFVAVHTAIFQRSVVKYEERGYRFALLEAGMLGYSLMLAASGQGYGSLNWGAFYDNLVDQLLGADSVTETTVNCVFIGKATD